MSTLTAFGMMAVAAQPSCVGARGVPFYFAYGANLDVEAMRLRCAQAKPLGPARLMNHRFFIMTDGVASVRRHAGAVVHGLLWDLALSDVAPLDAFEDVGNGHYTKTVQPVLRAVGSAAAFLYLGYTDEEGLPRPGYLESIVAAARSIGLPPRYVRTLAAWGRGGTQGPPFDNLTADAPPAAMPAVRARFATPLDRD